MSVSYPQMGEFSFSHSGTYADTDRIVGKAATLKNQFDSRGNELRTALNALINRINNHEGDGTGLVSIADLNAILEGIRLPEGQGSGLMAQTVYDPNHVSGDIFMPVGGEDGDNQNRQCGMMRLTDKTKLDRIVFPDGVIGEVPIPALTDTVVANNSDKAVTGKAVADYIGSGNLFERIWKVDSGTTSMVVPSNPFQLSNRLDRYKLLLATFKINGSEAGSPMATVVFIPGTSARVTAEYATITYGRTITTEKRPDLTNDTVTFSNAGKQGTADGTGMKGFLIPNEIYGIMIGAST